MAPGWWKKFKDSFNKSLQHTKQAFVNVGNKIKKGFNDFGKKVKDTFTSQDFKDGFNSVMNVADNIPVVGNITSLLHI